MSYLHFLPGEPRGTLLHSVWGGTVFFGRKTWLDAVKTTALVTVAESQGERADPLAPQLFSFHAKHAVGGQRHSSRLSAVCLLFIQSSERQSGTFTHSVLVNVAHDEFYFC